jgi:hypothetical protein
MTLVLKDNPVASSAPEPLRLKNIFPAKQHRSNGNYTNLPRTIKGTEIVDCLLGNTALS